MARVVVKMFRERDCAMCGKPFMPTCSNMKTCDPGCGIALSKLTAARRKESKRQSTKKQCVVCGDEFSEHQVRAYFGLDQKEPKKYVAKSLAECEALRGKTG